MTGPRSDDAAGPQPAAGPRWSASTIEARERLSSWATLDAPMADRCTYRVGGPAAVLVDVDSFDDLQAVAEVVADTDVAVLSIGRGSNVLVADAGFDGVVVVLGPSFARTSLDGTESAMPPGVDGARLEPRDLEPGTVVIVRAGGAALLPVVARASVRAHLSGFEWAVGVPGSVGGAVRMNAGGHGADVADTLLEAEVFDLRTGEVSRRSAAQLELGYRTSSLGPFDLVVEASFGLTASPTGYSGDERLGEIVRWRRDHQPGGPNAGSVFANPVGDSAGRLIDELGLKGLRVGSASVSTKHANFIQTDPGGSADDVFALISLVRRRVLDATGIELRPENRLIGFDGEGVTS